MRQRASEQPVGDAVLPGMPTICVGTRIVKPAQYPIRNDSDYAALLNSLPCPCRFLKQAVQPILDEQNGQGGATEQIANEPAKRFPPDP